MGLLEIRHLLPNHQNNLRQLTTSDAIKRSSDNHLNPVWSTTRVQKSHCFSTNWLSFEFFSWRMEKPLVVHFVTLFFSCKGIYSSWDDGSQGVDRFLGQGIRCYALGLM